MGAGSGTSATADVLFEDAAAALEVLVEGEFDFSVISSEKSLSSADEFDEGSFARAAVGAAGVGADVVAVVVGGALEGLAG